MHDERWEPSAIGTTDREWVARLAAGDCDALAGIYGKFGGLVFGICRRVLNDQALAEDVTQDVFLFLWQQPDRFDPARGSLKTWLAMLAHRRSVDKVRAETRRAAAENAPLAVQAHKECDSDLMNEVDDYLAATWLSDRVRDALGKLPTEQREAVMLAYYGGRTYREVAAELAIPEGTAKSRLRLAMRKLGELLQTDYVAWDSRAWT